MSMMQSSILPLPVEHDLTDLLCQAREVTLPN